MISTPSVRWASHFVSELRAGCNPLPFTWKPPRTKTGVYRAIFAVEVCVILRLEWDVGWASVLRRVVEVLVFLEVR
jgi:hypothetical protein